MLFLDEIFPERNQKKNTENTSEKGCQKYFYEFDFNIILPDGTREPGIGQGEWTILEPKTKR